MGTLSENLVNQQKPPFKAGFMRFDRADGSAAEGKCFEYWDQGHNRYLTIFLIEGQPLESVYHAKRGHYDPMEREATDRANLCANGYINGYPL